MKPLSWASDHCCHPVTFARDKAQDSHPIELWSPAVIDQKMEYIHMNPVVAGCVAEPHYWKYSSAVDYNGGEGVLRLLML